MSNVSRIVSKVSAMELVADGGVGFGGTHAVWEQSHLVYICVHICSAAQMLQGF